MSEDKGRQVPYHRSGGGASARTNLSALPLPNYTLPAEKPRCAVGGMVRPGAMCGSVIVGGEFCGHAGECPHKLAPNAALTRGAKEGEAADYGSTSR